MKKHHHVTVFLSVKQKNKTPMGVGVLFQRNKCDYARFADFFAAFLATFLTAFLTAFLATFFTAFFFAAIKIFLLYKSESTSNFYDHDRDHYSRYTKYVTVTTTYNGFACEMCG